MSGKNSKSKVDALLVLQNMAIGNILKKLGVEYTEGHNVEAISICDYEVKTVVMVNPNKLMIISHLTDAATAYFSDIAGLLGTPRIIIMPEDFCDLVELEVKIRTAVENATHDKHMEEFINKHKVFGDQPGKEVFKYYSQDEETKMTAVVTCDYADGHHSYSDSNVLQIKTISVDNSHTALADALITVIGNTPATTSLVSIETKPVKELFETYFGLALLSAGFSVVAKTSVGGWVLVVDPQSI